jgi:fumarate hydratase class I
MRDITPEILELVRFTSTNLPPDAEKALRDALEIEEPGTAAHNALLTILKNVEMTRRNSTPICQDTGTPIFFVRYPEGWSPRRLREQIKAAVWMGRTPATTWATSISPPSTLKKAIKKTW